MRAPVERQRAVAIVRGAAYPAAYEVFVPDGSWNIGDVLPKPNNDNDAPTKKDNAP